MCLSWGGVRVKEVGNGAGFLVVVACGEAQNCGSWVGGWGQNRSEPLKDRVARQQSLSSWLGLGALQLCAHLVEEGRQ